VSQCFCQGIWPQKGQRGFDHYGFDHSVLAASFVFGFLKVNTTFYFIHIHAQGKQWRVIILQPEYSRKIRYWTHHTTTGSVQHPTDARHPPGPFCVKHLSSFSNRQPLLSQYIQQRFNWHVIHVKASVPGFQAIQQMSWYLRQKVSGTNNVVNVYEQAEMYTAFPWIVARTMADFIRHRDFSCSNCYSFNRGIKYLL
jgi:hypothetical protein